MVFFLIEKGAQDLDINFVLLPLPVLKITCRALPAQQRPSESEAYGGKREY